MSEWELVKKTKKWKTLRKGYFRVEKAGYLYVGYDFAKKHSYVLFYMSKDGKKLLIKPIDHDADDAFKVHKHPPSIYIKQILQMIGAPIGVRVDLPYKKTKQGYVLDITPLLEAKGGEKE